MKEVIFSIVASYATSAYAQAEWKPPQSQVIHLDLGRSYGPPVKKEKLGISCDRVPDTTEDRTKSGWGSWSSAHKEPDLNVVYRIHFATLLNTAKEHEHLDCLAEYVEIEVTNRSGEALAGQVVMSVDADETVGLGRRLDVRKVVDYYVTPSAETVDTSSVYTVYFNPAVNAISVGDHVHGLFTVHLYVTKNYIDENGNFSPLSKAARAKKAKSPKKPSASK